MSAVEIAREAKRKEKADQKAVEYKAEQGHAAMEKFKESLEATISKVFNEFGEVEGFSCITGPSKPGRKRWILKKKDKVIAEAYVGYRGWDNPNYDYKVREGGQVIIWNVDGNETYTEGWTNSFEKNFGYAMRNYM